MAEQSILLEVLKMEQHWVPAGQDMLDSDDEMDIGEMQDMIPMLAHLLDGQQLPPQAQPPLNLDDLW